MSSDYRSQNITETAIRPTLIILPGFDGTGLLSDKFASRVPDRIGVIGIGYPTDRPIGLEGLVVYIGEHIPGGDPLLLMAVSFSGPVGIRPLSRANRNYVGAVFARRLLMCRIGLLWITKFVPPGRIVRNIFLRSDRIIRRFFPGPGDHPELLRQFKRAARKPTADVMTQRLRPIARVDERERLEGLGVPVLCMAASSDRRLPQDTAEQFRKRLKDMTIDFIDGPHVLLLSRPAETWGSVARFLLVSIRIRNLPNKSDFARRSGPVSDRGRRTDQVLSPDHKELPVEFRPDPPYIFRRA